MYGTVWIVATPLGNLGDFSPRARQTLEEADVILAEDTRRAGHLLQLAGVAGKRFLSLHEHNESSRIAEVLALLEQGLTVAVVSDAGTPLIADPGYRLVAACRQQGISVVPVPGPCAPITALMASGLPPYPFVFLGFLPRKGGDARTLLRSYAQIGATLVFFERKNRVLPTLELAFEVLGEREFCLARELTKKHEQFINGRLGQLRDFTEELLGEVTVVIGPPEEIAATSRTDVLDRVQGMMRAGMHAKDAARTVRDQTSGWSVKEIYELIVEQNAE
ncbi:16S rRNA (cytidine(1402)-2'-O)-methyltransferase [Desulfomicrobium baculatum]|uniref:Ribosomal RNA small subunit methyltransferase I n=1 Tax=Desulfomicrobium baculatum (strain DSM 4028 / VKM B-1378 / X) TaxID=525897 RepID=C7LP68_DESBD|nr:16S rRNA (cytidine(1402)-2'-O)-methyltransferase [Desulfomicrobium baculatum]ACU91384.1 Uroporphyrin-III C/tetrapyrrole (Corrin/Porphyrin) methyltransferase [Desulfomicrobium baculatum DSM 4028]